MARYGAHPLDISKYLEFSSEDTRDWSVDILLGLATAYQAVLELEKRYNGATYLEDKQLMISSIERAWREALYVRASLPSLALNDIDREISISRLGVVNEKDSGSRVWEESSLQNNGGCSPDERNIKKKRGTRVFRRKVNRR